MSVNHVILIGNLGADCEIRFLPDSKAVANFRIATTETWKDKGGVKQEKTDWHNIVAFGKLAEVCGQHLKKGKQVYISGKLQTRSWEDKDGNKRYTTEVVASVMQLLEKKESKPAEVSDIPF